MSNVPEIPARSRVIQILPDPEDYLNLIQGIILEGLARKDEEITFYIPGLIARAYTIVHKGEAIQFSYIPSAAFTSDDVKGGGF